MTAQAKLFVRKHSDHIDREVEHVPIPFEIAFGQHESLVDSVISDCERIVQRGMLKLLANDASNTPAF